MARTIVSMIGLSTFIAAQDDKCFICQLEFNYDPDDNCTIDHVEPLDQRLQNAGNLLIAHKKCNNAKGNRLPTQDELDTLQRVNEILQYDAENGLYRTQSNYVNIMFGRNKYK